LREAIGVASNILTLRPARLRLRQRVLRKKPNRQRHQNRLPEEAEDGLLLKVRKIRVDSDNKR
jgi:hypothetical protein